MIDALISDGGLQSKYKNDGLIKAHNIVEVREWGIEAAVVGSGLINSNGTIAENLAEIQLQLDKND